MATTSTDWQQIEAEAREAAALELDRREHTPLVFGESIAWAECRFGRTDGLSAVHRVGVPVKDEPYTTCGEPIPAPARWLALTPGFIRSLDRCRYCDAEQSRITREHAA